VYWFGHAPLNNLNDAQSDVTIVGWDFPEKLMLPTGQFLTRQHDTVFA
jgi:hypothetical protein